MNVTRASPLVWIPFLVLTLSHLAALESRGDEAPGAKGEMIGREAGQVRDDNFLGMKFVWCPPGFVTMGEEIDSTSGPETKPVRVLLTRGYWLGKHEVTQSEWKQILGTSPWQAQDWVKEGNDFPATLGSWDDAMEFCRLFTQRERAAGRLVEEWAMGQTHVPVGR